jgi:hypothetical protein
VAETPHPPAPNFDSFASAQGDALMLALMLPVFVSFLGGLCFLRAAKYVAADKYGNLRSHLVLLHTHRQTALIDFFSVSFSIGLRRAQRGPRRSILSSTLPQVPLCS